MKKLETQDLFVVGAVYLDLY